MPLPLPPAARPLLRSLVSRPWTSAAQKSPGVRRWCDQHGYITPHFTWDSYACQDGTKVPGDLRANAIRLHWRLEELRHGIGDLPVTVDGPYRTHARNTAVGGAPDSRHVHADGADFFVQQVDRWVAGSARLASRRDVLALVDGIFHDGGVGNEPSGTLHLDARGQRVRFVTW